MNGPVDAPGMPAAIGPYSSVYRAGELLFVAGQPGIDRSTGSVPPGGFEPEARQAFENLRSVIEAAGASLDRVVKTTVFLTSADDFTAMNALFAEYFSVDPPTRSTPIVGLPRGLRISLDAVVDVGPRPAAGATDAAGGVTDADRDAIMATAVDYIESWFDGDGDRMARCLHPELAKRSVERPDGDGARFVETTTRDEMVAATAAGRGTRYAREYEARIDDAFGDVASVRVFSSVYVDYLHIGRFDERWLIVNALWQRRPGR